MTDGKGMKFAFRLAIGIAAVSALAQAWVTFDWIDNLGDHCDYPEECLSSWLPWAFAMAEYLWVLTVLAGGSAVVLGALLRRPSLDIAALGGAWGASFISYWLSPMVQASPGEPVDWHVVEGNPLFWGGPGYLLTALLMAGAATVFGWQFLRSLKDRVQVEVSDSAHPMRAERA